MKCEQCNHDLIEPRNDAPYCEHCGFPDENRHTFTLIEIKSYLQSMFKRANCGDQAAGGIEENNRLACAFNLLLDEYEGIAKHCDDGKADGKKFEDFRSVRLTSL